MAPTPVMAQYWAIKEQYPDSLLFFRMGDFYELFFDDAVKAAQALDIALTKRGRHLGEDIPMCGVPVHSHESYLARLIRRGFKVAVCEQTEDPNEARKRGAKAVVRRDVVRLVTSGTLTEDALLDARRSNYLAALAEVSGSFGLAWIDISTGEFHTRSVAGADLAASLAALEPQELLIGDGLAVRADLAAVLADWQDRLTVLSASRFDSINGRRRLEALFKVASLDAFGAFGRAELAAGGALVDYVELTQRGRLPRLAPPSQIPAGAVMAIDAQTRRNLELTRSLAGEREGSLLAVIDRTVTGGGARLLNARLAAPLTEVAAIQRRLDMVAFFLAAEGARAVLRDQLRRCPDLQRASARITLGRGGPRDLAAIGQGLALTAEIDNTLAEAALTTPLPRGIAAARAALGNHQRLAGRLAEALAGELPVLSRDGGFIARGYHADLDELIRLRDEGRSLMAALQARYAAETGIAALKIRHNNVLGYFIEVPARQAERLAADEQRRFIHRQTMAGCVRFTTVELTDLEARISRAGEQAIALELALFAELCGEVCAQAQPIAEAAGAIAELDVAAALAELASEQRFARPVVEDGTAFEIRSGRHPVVETALRRTGHSPFVANDCDLAPDRRLWLITGPNMAGKSTFLRQNALIAVLAQIGSYVPAEEARIGIVDRLFSRVGAADDLARGRSTFMVEMIETATILNQAGPRSLVILDEIGRGTATFDGLSIAWAVVEHLHDVNRCRALFATHFHELTTLAAKLPHLACHTVRVKEWQGDVVFLHEVVAGAADRSYGIHVGKLAGLPAAVVSRAEEVLAALEKGEEWSPAARLADDLPLFAAAQRRAHQPPAQANPLAEALASVDADALTPREALDLIYRLKEML